MWAHMGSKHDRNCLILSLFSEKHFLDLLRVASYSYPVFSEINEINSSSYSFSLVQSIFGASEASTLRFTDSLL